jgi:hypothetical protein
MFNPLASFDTLTLIQDKTNNVIDLYKDIPRAVENLATCTYSPEAFSELISKIQTAVCFFRRVCDRLPIRSHNRSID